MIVYFSGTGNSRLVATLIARATGDRLLELPTPGAPALTLGRGENLGIVTPTYFLGLPTVVKEFLGKAEVNAGGDNYIFTVVTYGTISGNISRQLAQLMEVRGIAPAAQYSVRMVDVWTPVFNLTDRAKCDRLTLKAVDKTSRIAKAVTERRSGNRDGGRLPAISRLFYRQYAGARLTRHLHLMANRCTGCGLCQRQCPTGSIRLDQARRPRWVNPACAMCLRCLHHCPAFAIQYGKNTEGHGQWTIPPKSPFYK